MIITVRFPFWQKPPPMTASTHPHQMGVDIDITNHAELLRMQRKMGTLLTGFGDVFNYPSTGGMIAVEQRVPIAFVGVSLAGRRQKAAVHSSCFAPLRLDAYASSGKDSGLGGKESCFNRIPRAVRQERFVRVL